MSSGKKKYLVTGGAGFIGSALVRRMVEKGHFVRILDNESRGSAQRLKTISKDIEFQKADIRDAQAVQKAAKGMDSVCHLAFINGTEYFYSQPEIVLDVGVKGIVNVIDACLKHHVGELVLASSSEVYQTPPVIPTDESVPLSIADPRNPRYSYAAGKMISEIMTINYGRKHLEHVLIFRPHNVYGPDMGWEHVIPQFVVRMKKRVRELQEPIPFPIQGTGKETRSFVFIDDFIDGAMLVLERGEHLGIYHIGTMEELSIAEVARLVGEYFGKQIKVLPGEPAEGGTPRRCPDINKMASLGYQPKFAFREGLPIVAKWYDENAHRAPKH